MYNNKTDIRKNAFLLIRVQSVNYQDKDFIDIREYYINDPTDEFKPTKKGVTIPPEKISELMAALQKIYDSLEIALDHN